MTEMPSVRPLTPFKVAVTKQLDIDHRDILSLLYTPIIGPEALSLYFSLHAMCDRSQLRSADHPHSFLFDLLSLNQAAFMRARQRLEAAGLMESFHDGERCLYKLYLPLPADGFMKDSPFAAYLNKQLGEKRFQELTVFFKIRHPKTAHLENTTAAFTDVFAPAYAKIDVPGNFIVGEIRPMEIATALDIDAVIDALPETLNRKKIGTRAAKERLVQMAYIYSLDALSLKECMLQSLDSEGMLDFDALSSNCKKQYHNQPTRSHLKKTAGYDLDYFQRVHPKNLVEDLTGAHIPASDLAIIEKLIAKFDWPLEVINVLIAYVLRELDYRFPAFNYFEKVSAEWKRSGVNDAESAIERVKKRKQKKDMPSRRYGKKDLPEDIEVDWLDDYIRKLRERS